VKYSNHMHNTTVDNMKNTKGKPTYQGATHVSIDANFRQRGLDRKYKLHAKSRSL